MTLAEHLALTVEAVLYAERLVARVTDDWHWRAFWCEPLDRRVTWTR